MTKKDEIKEVDIPEDTIQIKINGEEKELFMSAGMLRKLAGVVQGLDDITAIHLEPSVQERCILELLVERDEKGKPVEDVEDMSLIAYSISTSDAEKLCKWIGEHVFGFFIRGADNMATAAKAHVAAMENLTQSLDGTNSSLTEKQ